MGIFGAPMAADGAYQPPKRTFLDKLGLLADAFTGTNQNGAQLQQVEQRAYDQWAQQASEQRRQAAQYAMWQQQKEWERANPAAPQPTEFERTVQAAGIQPGTPEYIQIMRQRAEAQASAPPMVVTNPDNTKTIYPAGSIPRGPASAPSAPVGKLTPIPGGAGSQGPGMFPLR